MIIFRDLRKLLLAFIALSAAQSSAQTRIHSAILVIDTSNNASYNQVHWLVRTPYLSIKSSNETAVTPSGCQNCLSCRKAYNICSIGLWLRFLQPWHYNLLAENGVFLFVDKVGRLNAFQERIQDFPDGGANPKQGGRQTYYLAM